MSYVIVDANGYVGDFASGGGLEALMDWLADQTDPLLSALADEGTTDQPAETAAALRRAPVPEDSALASTVRTLADLLDRCEEIAIISDGIEPEEETASHAAGQKKNPRSPAPSPGRSERFVL